MWYGSNENIYERYLYTIDPIDGAAGMGGNLSMLGNPGAEHVFDAPAGNPAGTGSAAGFYRRDEQTVWYDSPNWNGFTFGAAIGTQYAKTQNTNPRAVGNRGQVRFPRNSAGGVGCLCSAQRLLWLGKHYR